MTSILPDNRKPQPPAERIPGDFRRDSNGTPYVSDPSGDTVKSGKRKGEVKWVKYSRPSGFGDQIEDTYNLQKWSERQIVLGIATDREILRDAVTLIGGDQDDKGWRATADGCVVAAKRAAKANLAAERGTHSHAVVEDDTTGVSWVRRAEAGEDLGLPLEVQAAMVAAWNAMLTAYDLTVLAVELPVVSDKYRTAGTLDSIVRLGRDIRFMIDGEVITLPAGTVPVLDLKTGKLKLDGERIAYWNGYAIQVAVYAASVPYDTTLEQRRAWEWPIDQKWALIAHLPVDEALAGNAVCRLVLVDLERGRHAADICLAAKAWEASIDALGMVHPDEPSTTVAVDPGRGPAADGGVEAVVAASASPADPFDGLVTQNETPSLATKPYVVPVPTAVPVWTATPAPEGDEVDAKTVWRLTEGYKRRDAAKQAVMREILKDAQRAGVPFGQVEKNPTMRRFELGRALLAVADHATHEGEIDDALVRGALVLVMGDRPEVAHAPIGALIGCLDPDEARSFVRVLEGVSDGTYVADFSTNSLLLKQRVA